MNVEQRRGVGGKRASGLVGVHTHEESRERYECVAVQDDHETDALLGLLSRGGRDTWGTRTTILASSPASFLSLAIFAASASGLVPRRKSLFPKRYVVAMKGRSRSRTRSMTTTIPCDCLALEARVYAHARRRAERYALFLIEDKRERR